MIVATRTINPETGSEDRTGLDAQSEGGRLMLNYVAQGDGLMAWEIKPTTVYHLYRDGEPIRDEDGNVVHYPSEAAAQATADTWATTRNWYAELRSMSDQDLEARVGQLGWRAAIRRHLWGWDW